MPRQIHYYKPFIFHSVQAKRSTRSSVTEENRAAGRRSLAPLPVLSVTRDEQHGGYKEGGCGIITVRRILGD